MRLYGVGIVALFATLFASTGLAQDGDVPPGAAPAPRRPGEKSFAEKTVFTERSRLSAVARVAIRIGGSVKSIPENSPEYDYDLSKETFQLYVPADYDGKQPYGLFVWISAGPSGLIEPEWLGALAAHKLIAVGADKSGNDRPTWIRLGLALDAVDNLQKKYNVDRHRIYVAGGSGGGRCASQLGVAYPDVFEGGFYMVGCNFYRVMTNAKGVPWGMGYVKPPAKYLTLAQHRSRHVLLTGDADPNREQTHVYYTGFKEDGFKHVEYIEIPNFGHQLPNLEWFDKGLKLLDPVPDEEKVAAAKASESAKNGEAVKQADAPKSGVAVKNGEADKLLSAAKLYANNHRYDGARTRLNKLIETYPGTPQAAQAKELLEEIEGK